MTNSRGGMDYLEAGIRLMVAAQEEDTKTRLILERLSALYWTRYMKQMSPGGCRRPVIEQDQ